MNIPISFEDEQLKKLFLDWWMDGDGEDAFMKFAEIHHPNLEGRFVIAYTGKKYDTGEDYLDFSYD